MKVVEFRGNKKDLALVADELKAVFYNQDPPLNMIEVLGLLEAVKLELVEEQWYE